MEIAAIGVPADTSPTQRAGIGQEDFLRVLLAQLTFQDPLEPLDNNEFIAQFAQLTSLEQTQQLNERMDALLSLQGGGQAIDLIGRVVEARTDFGGVVGEVTSVAFQNGVPEMTIRSELGQFVTGITLGQVSIIQQGAEE